MISKIKHHLIKAKSTDRKFSYDQIRLFWDTGWSDVRKLIIEIPCPKVQRTKVVISLQAVGTFQHVVSSIIS